MQVTLHRDDIVNILNLIDKVNPVSDNTIGSGCVMLHVDQSSGIGAIVTAELPATVNGLKGTFRQKIMDESSW
jgi:hypothetical protein